MTVSGAVVAAVLGLALPAAAHTPVFLDATDTAPQVAPLAVNGEDPLSFRGAVFDRGAKRSFQLHMAAGQQLNVSTTVPNLAPENQLTTEDLPRVTIIAPDGQSTTLEPTMRVPVSFGGFHYLVLNSYEAPAVPGTYSIVVTGGAPARFNVSTGIESDKFHGLERGSAGTREQVVEWYNTPPRSRP